MQDDIENDPVAKRFIEFYRSFYWRNESGSSGPNSDARLTPQLREQLSKLFEQYKIKSLCDAGCGDANLFFHMTLALEDYVGIDCVPEIIDLCRERFKDQPQYHFKLANLLEMELPKVDLILCRDVVHYLPNDLIFGFLKQCMDSKSTWLLMTHNLRSKQSANDHNEVGQFRPVDLTCAPFNWPEPHALVHEDVEHKALALWSLDAIRQWCAGMT